MRLIDAEKLKRIFEEDSVIGNTINRMIDEQPTAYDVDNVVEQLEECVKEYANVDYNRAMIEAIEIVKSVSIE